MYKKLYFIGIVVYGFLFLLSILFYKERTIFLDSSFNIFHLVKEGTFCIASFRFGDVLTQALPLLCYKLGLSLGAITWSYSISFTLYYLICYVICGSLLKQYRFALLILLVNILFATYTFYFPVSQLPQGMALVMVAFALIWGRPLKYIGALRWIAITATIITMAFFHPLVVFVLGYSILFFLVSKDRIDKKVMYVIAGVFFSLLIIKSVFFRTQYERHSLSGLKNVVRLFPDYFTLYSNGQLLKNCITKYYWLAVFFFSIAALYLSNKAYKKLLLFAGTVVGYLLLVNIMYPDAQTPSFYIENLYLPIGICIGLPLVFDMLPVLEQRKVAFPVMVLVMLTGCIRIYTAHDHYTQRLGWERDFLRKNGDKKIIANASLHHADILEMLWGTPYEFWQLSTIETGKSASVIIDDDPPHRDWAKNTINALVVNWNVFPYRELNPKYFRYSDTVTGYIIETTNP